VGTANCKKLHIFERKAKQLETVLHQISETAVEQVVYVDVLSRG